MLDAPLQSAGGTVPPKWEPRSCIGVYLGHLPFHAGSVALVWNSTTGRVSPQYHVVFDDDFSTVPYMEAGTLPLNWEDLVKYSSEMATTTDVDLADTWLNGQSAAGATDQISDPFAIVTDNAKRPRTDTPGSKLSTLSNNIHTSNSEGYNSNGISSGPSKQEQSNQAAANSFANTISFSNNQPRAGAHIDTIGPDPAEALQIPVRMNPHENGLCRSPRFREQK